MQRILPAFHGIAILAVILNHSINLLIYTDERLGLSLPAGLESYAMTVLASLGVLAVPVFLFSSGSFFVYSTHGKGLASSYKVVWAGFLRLVWPYILWSILFYVLLFFIEGTTYSVTGYIKNLLVGYPYHFVPLLLFFYAIAPLLVVFSQKHPWLLLGLVGLYQLYLVIATSNGAFGFVMPGWAQALSIPIIRSTFAKWGLFFPLGIAFMQHSGVLLEKAWKLRNGLLVLSILFFLVLAFGQYPLTDILWPLVTIPVIVCLKRESIPYVRALEQIGKKSYGLYLMNLIVVNLILMAIFSILPALYAFQLLVALITFIFSLLLIFLIIEGAGRTRRPKIYQFIFG